MYSMFGAHVMNNREVNNHYLHILVIIGGGQYRLLLVYENEDCHEDDLLMEDEGYYAEIPQKSDREGYGRFWYDEIIRMLEKQDCPDTWYWKTAITPETFTPEKLTSGDWNWI